MYLQHESIESKLISFIGRLEKMIRTKNLLATTFQCTQYVYIPMVFERWYKIQILTDRKINSAQTLLV